MPSTRAISFLMQPEDEVITGTQDCFTGRHTRVLVSCSPVSPDMDASNQDIEAIAEGGLASHRDSVYAASRTVSASDIAADPTVKRPTRWSVHDRSKLLTASEDGRILQFHSKHFPLPPSDINLNLTLSLQAGPLSTTGEKEAATARANHPIPSECITYYFEVTIMDKGRKG